MPDRDHRFKSAVAQHDAGRLAEAERGYRELLAERPDDAEAMHLLGVLLHQSGRNDQALELIRRSLELDGLRPNVHSNLASVLGRAGHAAEALHHLREALRLSPNLPEAHNNLGVTLEGMNRPKEAEPAYRKAIELRPTYAEAHHHLLIVTFGSLNKLAKVSDPCARLWARVLDAVPGSRLVLAAQGGEAGNRSARGRLQSLGIPGDRLELVDKAPSRMHYLRRFDSIDIALDPLPFCGITTTCDALWQGVPAVSLAGDTPVSRAGLSILTAAGLPDWVAETPTEYVRIAARAAGDLPALAALRSKLRSQVAEAPLTNAALHTQQLEQAYRQLWRDWCATRLVLPKS